MTDKEFEVYKELLLSDNYKDASDAHSGIASPEEACKNITYRFLIINELANHKQSTQKE